MTADNRRAIEDRIRKYFVDADSGHFPDELFTENFEFYFPKFGVGHGRQQLIELATRSPVASISHRLDTLRLIVDGNCAAVEGTSEGVTKDGRPWDGGTTPGGRFCSVFIFNDQLKIERMFIYLDPDYAGSETSGFLRQPADNPPWEGGVCDNMHAH